MNEKLPFLHHKLKTPSFFLPSPLPDQFNANNQYFIINLFIVQAIIISNVSETRSSSASSSKIMITSLTSHTNPTWNKTHTYNILNIIYPLTWSRGEPVVVTSSNNKFQQQQLAIKWIVKGTDEEEEFVVIHTASCFNQFFKISDEREDEEREERMKRKVLKVFGWQN